MARLSHSAVTPPARSEAKRKSARAAAGGCVGGETIRTGGEEIFLPQVMTGGSRKEAC